MNMKCKLHLKCYNCICIKNKIKSSTYYLRAYSFFLVDIPNIKCKVKLKSSSKFLKHPSRQNESSGMIQLIFNVKINSPVRINL